MKRRFRRRQHVNTELDITAFLNLMVILIPFLLITAVFSRITVLDLYLPPETQSSKSVVQKFQLEVVIRKDAVYLSEASSRFKKKIKFVKENFDYLLLQKYLIEIKKQFPDKRDAAILSEADIEYDILIQIMDHVRMHEVTVNGVKALEDLFPGLSIGDAPIVNEKMNKEVSKK